MDKGLFYIILFVVGGICLYKWALNFVDRFKEKTQARTDYIPLGISCVILILYFSLFLNAGAEWLDVLAFVALIYVIIKSIKLIKAFGIKDTIGLIVVNTLFAAMLIITIYGILDFIAKLFNKGD